MNITYYGPITDFGGYAQMNRAYIKILHNLGFNIQVIPFLSAKNIDKKEDVFFRSLYGHYSKIKEDDIFIYGHSLDHEDRMIQMLDSKVKTRIIFSMLETDRINKKTIELCNKYFTHLLTPSEYCLKLFIQSGLNIPATVMEIPVDDRYDSRINDIKPICPYSLESFPTLVSQKEASIFPDHDFKFLSVFRWSFRKGFDVLIKAFLSEFTYKDNVSLSIFTRHLSQSQSMENNIFEDISRITSEYQYEESAPIYVFTDPIPDPIMPRVYRLGDCFVLPSRGEGLCLPAIEAAFVGTPLIVPDHTGFSDYVISSGINTNAMVFNKDQTLMNYSDNISWQESQYTSLYFNTNFFKFGIKTIKELSQEMREAYNSKLDLYQLVQKMYKSIEKYKNERCKNKITEFLISITDEK